MVIMQLSMSIDELLGYTQGERDKWEQWLNARPPTAMDAPVQREGNFNDVWRLMERIFVVEKRHTQRLKQESPLSERTGAARGDAAALFGFGRAVRQELIRFIGCAAEADLGRVIELRFLDQRFTFTARKLIFHMQFHEIRHWAQIATAVRNGGYLPPGYHDLLFSDAVP
jgi:uncharacterized damage-inducible protein DinB